MYDKDLIRQAKEYIYNNTNYSIDWINKLSSKKLLAIYFSLIKRRK